MSRPERSTRSPWQSCATTGRTPADGLPSCLSGGCRFSPANTATSTAPRSPTSTARSGGPVPDSSRSDQYADAEGRTTAPRAKPGVRGRHLRAIRRSQTQRSRRFDDLLALCHATMTQDTRFAEASTMASSPCPRRRVPGRQPAPIRALQSWLGPESSLVVVGDPNQAIYGWNGAKPELLDEISDHLPGCAVIHLRTNFRSPPRSSPPPRVLDITPAGRSSLRRRTQRAPPRCRGRSGRHRPLGAGSSQAWRAVAAPGRARSHQRSSQQCALHSSVRVSRSFPGRRSSAAAT